MPEELQRHPAVAADWTVSDSAEPYEIEHLDINVPGYSTVVRIPATGQVRTIRIANLYLADMVSLRDALTENIARVQEAGEVNGQDSTWAPL